MQVNWTEIPNNLVMPEIDTDEVLKYVKGVRPLFHHKGELYHTSVKSDPFKESFVWTYVRKKKAAPFKEGVKLWTLHKWADVGLFKPTLAEIVAQMPKERLEASIKGRDTNLLYFSIQGPQNSEDLGRMKEYVDKGFHVARVTVFDRDV